MFCSSTGWWRFEAALVHHHGLVLGEHAQTTAGPSRTGNVWTRQKSSVIVLLFVVAVRQQRPSRSRVKQQRSYKLLLMMIMNYAVWLCYDLTKCSHQWAPSYKELISITTYLRWISIATMYIRNRRLQTCDWFGSIVTLCKTERLAKDLAAQWIGETVFIR